MWDPERAYANTLSYKCQINTCCLELRLPSINVAQISTVGSTDTESVLNECNYYHQYLLRLPIFNGGHQLDKKKDVGAYKLTYAFRFYWDS